MLISLQRIKQTHDLYIIASHRHDRPEILSLADETIAEPNDESRVPFVVDSAINKGVSVLLTGRNGVDYEPYHSQLARHGVRLLTGATCVDTLYTIDDKFTFTQHCYAHNIPVATAWRFDSFDELTALIAKHGNQRLCIKPVQGIFAEGLWILDNHHGQTDPFYHLYRTNHKKIHTDEFLHAHQNSPHAKQTPMLLMPYLSGQEYSIDVVCERGEILGAITRHKVGSVQYVGYERSVMDVVVPLIQSFGADGIVSVQTRADEHGNHKVLEINPRPSRGIGYTVHGGLDLTVLAMLYFAGLTARPSLDDSIRQITPCKVRPLMTSVRIDCKIFG
ncbi:ATP-grasp domain-containing protein [Moraxella equi]|uniref:Carbamoyl-phosphate synthase large chain n=1 Tax=Moraxella equi TaxID=60442 RepID=A0A378QQG8_9GAMM|nr:ATP-grasp domain-containing protein [Moraxella equi]STZ03038.1 Carbamoyl-phosphate synthase large chain [Moraxella equi]